MTGFYEGRSALVTGGMGFLAAHVSRALLSAGARVRMAGRGPDPGAPLLPEGATWFQGDLQHRPSAVEACRDMDFVFHLAAVGWGFHENLTRQAELLTENLLLNTTMLDAARAAGAGRFLYASSSAVYPGSLEELQEDAPWDQPPHPGEAGFGWAKRMGEIQARFYADKGFPVAIVRPTNPYGPFDHFDAARSHVIPSLIKRALSGEDPFTVWGTGRAVRSFIYAPDAARGMLLALEKAADGTPINLGSGVGTSVADLSRLCLAACGRGDAEVRFDLSKPDGHPRKVPSVLRAAERLGLEQYTPLERGLQETVAWYLAHRNEREDTP